MAVGVWFIVAFALYDKKDKDGVKACSKPIGKFLLVSGISQIAFLVISLIATFGCKIGVKDTSASGKGKGSCGTVFMTFFLCLFLLFMFCWWIVGQAWTFSITKFQCNETLYLTSFWYLIVVYILIGLAIVVGIVVLCCFRSATKGTKAELYL